MNQDLPQNHLSDNERRLPLDICNWMALLMMLRYCLAYIKSLFIVCGAAFKTQDRYRRAVDWSVAAGKHSEKKPETTVQIRNVSAIVVNSHYNFLTSDNDIAVVKVDRPFAMTTYVNKVCLPTAAAVAGTTGIVTGWGYVEATCCPGVLKQALLPIISNRLCNQPDHLGNQVTDNMFCAGYEAGGHDACQGDSGGPLVTKHHDVWQIQGITSFGSGCADVRSPGVYTEVFNYISWIRQKVALNS